MEQQNQSAEEFDFHEPRLYQNYLSHTKFTATAFRKTWILSALLIAFLSGWISFEKTSGFVPFSISPIFASVCSMGMIASYTTREDDSRGFERCVWMKFQNQRDDFECRG